MFLKWQFKLKIAAWYASPDKPDFPIKKIFFFKFSSQSAVSFGQRSIMKFWLNDEKTP